MVLPKTRCPLKFSEGDVWISATFAGSLKHGTSPDGDVLKKTIYKMTEFILLLFIIYKILAL